MRIVTLRRLFRVLHSTWWGLKCEKCEKWKKNLHSSTSDTFNPTTNLTTKWDTKTNLTLLVWNKIRVNQYGKVLQHKNKKKDCCWAIVSQEKILIALFLLKKTKRKGIK